MGDSYEMTYGRTDAQEIVEKGYNRIAREYTDWAKSVRIEERLARLNVPTATFIHADMTELRSPQVRLMRLRLSMP